MIRKRRNKLVIVVLLVIVVFIGVMGGIFFVKSSIELNQLEKL